MASLEKWVLRVFKDYLDRKDREVLREMAALLEKMVFPEMLVRLVMLGFLVSQVCLAQLVLLELEAPMVPRYDNFKFFECYLHILCIFFMFIISVFYFLGRCRTSWSSRLPRCSWPSRSNWRAW